MKRVTDQTRCEKCGEVLITQYEQNGVASNAFRHGLVVTVIDRAQNRFGLSCPNCAHCMASILTSYPETGRGATGS